MWSALVWLSGMAAGLAVGTRHPGFDAWFNGGQPDTILGAYGYYALTVGLLGLAVTFRK